MLIIFGGLPGVGKTTLALKVAENIGGVYVRVDSIEIAVQNSSLEPKVTDVADAGYLAAFNIAKDNLLLGHTVIADSVNPVRQSQDGWRKVADTAKCDFLEVQVICSDKTEHQKRVKNRVADIDGHVLPLWNDVEQREIEDWEHNGLVIDTATHSIEDCIQSIVSALNDRFSVRKSLKE